MFDDKHLALKDVLHIVDPVDHLVGKSVKLLKIKTNSNDDSLALQNSIDRLRYEIVSVVGKYMQEKNKDKLDNLFKYYGSKKFVDAVLLDAKVQPNREKILENLIPLVCKYTPHLCKGLGLQTAESKTKGNDEKKHRVQ